MREKAEQEMMEKLEQEEELRKQRILKEQDKYEKQRHDLILREQEKNAFSEDCSQLIIIDGANSICEATFDVTKSNKISAILNIVKTCFI